MESSSHFLSFSVWRTPLVFLVYSRSRGNLLPRLLFIRNVLISPLFLKHSSVRCRILWQLLLFFSPFFVSLNLSFQCLLAFMVSNEKLACMWWIASPSLLPKFFCLWLSAVCQDVEFIFLGIQWTSLHVDSWLKLNLGGFLPLFLKFFLSLFLFLWLPYYLLEYDGSSRLLLFSLLP